MVALCNMPEDDVGGDEKRSFIAAAKYVEADM